MQLRLATSPRFVHADARETDLALRDAALLAWLALEGPTPRTRLAVLLWPRSAPDVAGNALRQRLFQLRRQLGVELVGAATRRWRSPTAWHTTWATRGRCSARPATSSAPSWPPGWRRNASAGALRPRAALEAGADVAERAGDYDAALAHARELLERERLSEATHRRMIRVLYLQGDRAAALLAFDRCERG